MSVAFASLLCVVATTGAQSLRSVMPSAPSAVKTEAPLPEAAAREKAALEKEKKAKLSTATNRRSSSNSKINDSYNSYIADSRSVFGVKAQTKGYTVQMPRVRIKNSSIGHQQMNWGSKEVCFNAKKDYLQNIAISNSRFQIFNRKSKPCKMGAFEFVSESDYVKIEGNKVSLRGTATQVATGVCPTEHTVVVRHIKSGLSFKMVLELYFDQSESCAGRHRVLALSRSDDYIENTGLLIDLTDRTAKYVQLPYTLYGSGADGSNGARGYNGLNGTNRVEYTDKEGKKHVIAGSCGHAGGNGGRGGDGGNGATFLILYSQNLYLADGLSDIYTTIEAGKGGKGGKGGLGGKHGNGSGCSGFAPNGHDGHDGDDGTRGDFLYVITDTESFVKQLNLK